MKTKLYHLEVKIQAANLGFYKELLTFLGWAPIYETDGMIGLASGDDGASLWFVSPATNVRNDYDGPGVNHIAIGTETQSDVDAAATYLADHGIAALFETPRHRPEFSSREGQTYYQVMFE